MTKRPKRSDLARTRAQNIFAGREQALEDFQRNLTLSYDDDRRKLIWMITGEGGMGKTTLLRRFDAILRDNDFVTTRVDESISPNVVHVMGAMAEQMEQQGHPLKGFMERYRVYRQLKSEIEADPERPKGVSTAIGRGVGRFVATSIKQIPMAGALADFAVDDEFIIEKTGELADFIKRKIGNKDEVQLVLEPLKVLTPLFIEGVSEIADKHPVGLFFDTYERTGEYLDEWLRDILGGDKYGELDVAVMIMIAGRDRLGQEWTNEHIHPFMGTMRLEPFTEQEAREYLDKQGITDEQAIEIILKLSGHVPVLLATLAGNLPDDPTQLGDVSGEAVERFLKWVGDETQRRAILDCALPRTLNLDVVTALLGAESAPTLFDFIKGMSFISRNASGGWVYHDVVRSLMLRHQRQESRQHWQDMQTHLVTYYADKRDSLGLELKAGLYDSDWQQLNLEWLYHTICVKGRGAANDWANCILDTYDPGSPADYDRRLGETIQEAGTTLENTDISEWGQTVVDAMVAWNSENYAKALPMLEVVVQEVDNVNVSDKARALGFLGHGNHNIGNNQSAIEWFSRAIELQPEDGDNFYWRGWTHLEMKAYNAALADFSRAIELQPEVGDNFYWRGWTYREMKAYDAALADFSRAIELQPEDGDNFYWRGQTYREMKAYDAALADFSRGNELQPEDGGNFYGRGRTHLEMKAYDAALADFSRAIELQPEDGSNFYWRGQTYREMKAYDAALADFSRAIELQPEDGGNFYGRGRTHLRMKAYDAALADFSRAIELQPEDGSNFSWRGGAHLEMKAYDAALADFSQAIELQPEDGGNFSWRGRTHLRMKAYDAALADFSRAIELQPEIGSNFSWRGGIHLGMKAHDAALADFSRAIELQPEDGGNFYGRGWTYREMKAYDAALADFSRAIELQPEDGSNFYGRGRTHWEMKAYDAALADFSRAIELQPEDGDNFSWRGQTYREMKAYDAALADFSRAIELQPEDGGNFYGRGWTHLEMKAYDAALADFSRAIELQPEDGDNFYGRGRTHLEMKAYDAALADFSRAIELQPEDGDNFYWRGQTYREMKAYDAALADFSQAIELQPEDGSNFYWRGFFYLWQDDFPAALTDLRQADALDTSPHTLFWLSIAYRVLNEVESANETQKQLESQIVQEEDLCLQNRVLAKLALAGNQADIARKYYLKVFQDSCEDNNLRLELSYLRLLEKLFPSQPAIRETTDWFKTQVDIRS